MHKCISILKYFNNFRAEFRIQLVSSSYSFFSPYFPKPTLETGYLSFYFISTLAQMENI
jgi:hypothetical protein